MTRRVMLLGMLLCALLRVPSANALDHLHQKFACVACHADDRKVVGPSFRDIANRYRQDATAEARLANKVRKGGAGVWGTLAMPPNPKPGDVEIQKMIRAILVLPPK